MSINSWFDEIIVFASVAIEASIFVDLQDQDSRPEAPGAIIDGAGFAQFCQK